jgi:acetyl-CoA acetyltransferase
MSIISGAGLTRFGKHPDCNTMDLMSIAAHEALESAQLERRDIDGVLCGYSSTMPHLMLATAFSEHFGIVPRYAHAIQVGGATGLALVMLAHVLIEAGEVERVLVVAGENRLTGHNRDQTMQALSQIGHPRYEVPLGVTVPAFYGLLADRYLYKHRLGDEDLAELAVLMRRRGAEHPGAHLRQPITVSDVLSSRPIATPLKLLDCCPISDGGAAIVLTSEATHGSVVRIRGSGQAHFRQHLSAAADLTVTGASAAAERALAQAGIARADIEYAAIYDSFTVTLAMLLEEIGLSEPGRAGADARDGRYNPEGSLPLNTHGGLLSYGHCGVAGGLSHLIEAFIQMQGLAGSRQLGRLPALAFAHGDGGVMSSHVSMVLERCA